MNNISADLFFKIVNQLDQIRFKGLEDYSASEFFFLPIYLALVSSEIKRPLRHCITPFVGSSEDYRLVGDADSPRTILFYSERYRGRKDMDAIIEGVRSCAVRPLVFWGRHHRKLNVRALGNLRNIHSWNKTLKQLGIDRKKRPYLFGQLARACNFGRFLKQHEYLICKAGSFVTLWDQDYDEALFTRFCQKRGMKTATLQHGIFSGSKNYGENLRQYPYCYDRLNADYFLAWGESSRQYAKEHGISPNRIIVVGNPKYISMPAKPLTSRTDAKYDLCLFLDGGYPANHNKNLEMLKMVQRLCEDRGLRAIVKAHPDYKRGEQEICDFVQASSALAMIDKNASILEVSSVADFFVVASSSVYAESLFLNVPVLRFVQPDSFDAFSRVTFGVFQSGDELIVRYDELKADPIGFIKAQNEIAASYCIQGDLHGRYYAVMNALADDEELNELPF